MQIDVVLNQHARHHEKLIGVLMHPKVVFLGKYPNWPENITAWAIYPEVKEYLDSPTAYWKKYGRYHPLLGENAFDPITGGYGDGFRYHTNFNKLGLTPEYADYVAFTELIGVPVSGVMNYHDPVQKAKDEAEFERLLHNQEHLEFLKNLLFEAADKVVFISRGVYNIVKSRQRELFGFSGDVLSCGFPNDHYDFRILYSHANSYLIAAQIFSSIIDETYYSRYRMLIDAIVKGIVLDWEIFLPNLSNKLTIRSDFKGLLGKLQETFPMLETMQGISINPIRQVTIRVYQLPALAKFFCNREDIDCSIHCLIHSIVSLEERKIAYPKILAYYDSFKHLLGENNRMLIEECLNESKALIDNKTEGLPPQSQELRNRFYNFSFQNLKELETQAGNDYFYAEKTLLETIWNTVLDNLSNHGSGDTAQITYRLSPQGDQALISVCDLQSSFDFEAFVAADKAINTYTKMNRFGDITIESGFSMWSSENPAQIEQTTQNTIGNVITLRFILPERHHG
ncbi:MAG: hypothetical protein RBS43_09160 [Candidatus Cloacimonas sp.]|nr:hypothetical protein [Candidatus Cloacimonas sp.]